jgi:STE24 endopeptidase
MNVYAIIILSTLLIRYFVDVAAYWLNLSKLKTPVPADFSDVYKPDEYARSQLYTTELTRFHIIQSTFSLVVFLIFWFAGGFNWLDGVVRAFHLNSIWTGILYIGILILANAIVSLPFDLYHTFVIEEAFGFNRATPRGFVIDRLKALGLMIVLGVPFLAVILWFFDAAGFSAWLYCWGIAILFGLIVQFIAPAWILPIFNKYTPLPAGELRDAILQYANSVGFSFKDIYIVDGSRRSTKANAFFTGFGKNKRIALYDTLVEQSTMPEVVAVLAHEIGHYKMKHIMKSMIFSFFHTGLVFFLLSLFVRSEGLFAAFKMDHISVYAGLLFFGMLYEPISAVLSVILNFFSRRHELEADRYAAKTIEDREYMVSALKKMYQKNLSTLTPHPLLVALKYSHPPLLRRVAEIRAA